MEDIWLKLELPDGNLYLCTVYVTSRSNNLSLLRGFYDKVFENISSINPNDRITIVGDFNTPDVDWGLDSNGTLQPNNANNDKALALLNIMNFGGFSQHNHVVNKDNNILDLVLSSDNCHSVNVYHTSVHVVPLDDYHPVIEIEIKESIQYLDDEIKRQYNFRKANYELIGRAIDTFDWRQNNQWYYKRSRSKT